MPGRLAGAVVLITGGGSVGEGFGNGKAMAIEMAREGAKVVVIDKTASRAEETVSLIIDEQGKAIAIEGDVSRSDDCRHAVDRTIEHFGQVDVLVNNVGIHGAAGDAITVDPEEWDRGMSTNLRSMVLMAKYAVPHMIAQGKGAVLNVSSTAGLMGGHPDLLYPTSKGAILNLTRAMAAHHGPKGVRVNCIVPGMLFSPRIVARGLDAKTRERRRLKSLLQTEGTAWDVAKAAVFLCSDDARWITGAILCVDGGLTAGNLDVPLPPAHS